MTFREYSNDDGWVTIDYASTWGYGYDFMLDAAGVLLSDFGEDLQWFGKARLGGMPFTVITEDVMAAKGKLRDCPALSEECGAVSVAGFSNVMECPFRVTFYNQTNAVRLEIPLSQMPEDHPARKRFDEKEDGFEHTFDCYMDSVEIKAYCADTERRVRAELAEK